MHIDLIGYQEENFSDYKKIGMYLAFPKCSFKCGDKCQNKSLKKCKTARYNIRELIKKYKNNPLTECIICSGLDPIDSFYSLLNFITEFRKDCFDDIVIYTGYELKELKNELKILAQFSNIYMKIGRYIPNKKSRYDKLLGVELVSDNQFGIKL